MRNYIFIIIFIAYYTYYCIAQSLQWSFQSFLQVRNLLYRIYDIKINAYLSGS